MSFKRKINKKIKKMPLSALDMWIYVLFEIFGISMIIIVTVIFQDLAKSVAYSDESVIALVGNGSSAALASMPLAMVISFSISLPPAFAIDRKQPLFGNKRFVPKPGQFVITLTPIMSRKFWQEMTEKTRKRLWTILVIIVALIFVCTVLVSFFILPRTVLDRENSLKTYDSFGNLTKTVNVEDSDMIIFSIDKGKGRRSRHYYIKMEITFAEKTYSFGTGSFEKMSESEALEYMIYLKSLVGENYAIDGIERMEKLINSQKYNAEEKALVYELFDYS